MYTKIQNSSKEENVSFNELYNVFKDLRNEMSEIQKNMEKIWEEFRRQKRIRQKEDEAYVNMVEELRSECRLE